MSNIIRLNETAPRDQWIVMSNQGTAGFDLNEMPWQVETWKEDADFLLCVTEEAQSKDACEKLPYEVNRDIVIPWLKQFAKLIRQMTSIPPIHTNLSD